MTPERVSLLLAEKTLTNSFADGMAASSSPLISTFPSLCRPISEETLLAAYATHSFLRRSTVLRELPKSCRYFQEKSCLLLVWF